MNYNVYGYESISKSVPFAMTHKNSCTWPIQGSRPRNVMIRNSNQTDCESKPRLLDVTFSTTCNFLIQFNCTFTILLNVYVFAQFIYIEILISTSWTFSRAWFYDLSFRMIIVFLSRINIRFYAYKHDSDTLNASTRWKTVRFSSRFFLAYANVISLW